MEWLGFGPELWAQVRRMLLEGWRWKGIMSALSAALVYLLGRPDEAARALLALMLLDLATALWANGRRGTLSSRVGCQKTVAKFIGYAITVAAGNLTGRIAPALGFGRVLAITYLAGVEVVSVLENLEAAGVRGLGALTRRLRSAQEWVTKDQEAAGGGDGPAGN